ncbi:hypothetical protein ACQPW1_15390 [Nocardia sp. CA-128927]|uniref:hypothetical protein n=1 Tax=Nocardia sp. CA-128927 TaxID=3239975 RepID=UPI003D961A42
MTAAPLALRRHHVPLVQPHDPSAADGPPGPDLDLDRILDAGLALLLDGITIRLPSSLSP